MGSCSFGLRINATNLEEFKKKFYDLVEEDRYENGHDAYSGTIGQKSGWNMLSSTPISQSKLSELKNRHEGDKWGNAMACPIAKVKTVSDVVTVTKTVDVLLTGWGENTEAIRLTVATLPENAKIVEKSIKVDKVSDPVYVAELTMKSKENEGWRVRCCGSIQPQIFKTQAEANKVAKELIVKGMTEVFKQGPSYKQVMKKPPVYKVTLQYQLTEITNEISHYEVWGWAAE
jgi:hypothetical protein